MPKISKYIGFHLDNMLINSSSFIPTNPNTPNPQGNWDFKPIAPNRPVHYPPAVVRIAAIITDAADQQIVGSGFNFQKPDNSGPYCAEERAYTAMVGIGYKTPSKIYIKSSNPKITPFHECLVELAQLLPDIIVVHVGSNNMILFEQPISALI